jgi:hypothetical protein
MRKSGVDEKSAFAAMMDEVSDSEGSSDSEHDSRPQPKQSSLSLSNGSNGDSKTYTGAKQEYKSGFVGGSISDGRRGSGDAIQDAIDNFGNGIHFYLFLFDLYFRA